MLYYYPSHREKVEQVRFLAELKGESVFVDIHPYAHRIQAQTARTIRATLCSSASLSSAKTDATLVSIAFRARMKG